MAPSVRVLEGNPHFVVPVVMLTSGVYSGSAGPVYYPAEVLNASVPYWNGRPVVVYHPAMQSAGMAGHPDVFDRQRVGFVFNAAFDGHRLTAEAWVDAARAGVVDARVRDALRARLVTEVSTGATLDCRHGAGRLDAHRMYPDHLAILPDQVGACSVAAGCGLQRI